DPGEGHPDRPARLDRHAQRPRGGEGVARRPGRPERHGHRGRGAARGAAEGGASRPERRGDGRAGAARRRPVRRTSRLRTGAERRGPVPARGSGRERRPRTGEAGTLLGEHGGDPRRPAGRRPGDSVGYVGVGRLRSPSFELTHDPGDRMSANGRPLIQLEGVTKVFYTDEVETHALASVHLEIKKGEYVSIAGPSGCGK